MAKSNKQYRVVFQKGGYGIFKNWTKVCRLLLLEQQLHTAEELLGGTILPQRVDHVYDGDRVVWNGGQLEDATRYEKAHFKKVYHPMTAKGLTNTKLSQLTEMKDEWIELMLYGISNRG